MIIATGSPTKRTRSRASSRRPGLERLPGRALHRNRTAEVPEPVAGDVLRSDDGEHTGHCGRVGSINAEDVGVRVRRSGALRHELARANRCPPYTGQRR